MSNCDRIKESLGMYVDGEFAPDTRREVESHLSSCPACANEVGEIQAIAAAIAKPTTATVPPDLWQRIERRLDSPKIGVRQSLLGIFRSRAGFAIAASIAVVIGLGLFTFPMLRDNNSRVQAATVDFGILLDGLHVDVRNAFDRFLSNYDAKETTPAEAKRFAPMLNFDMPSSLPGGFELKATYILRFGDSPGAAVRYDRDGEFLGAIFHPPILREDYGTHKDRACVLGQHRGHSVPVGEWTLVHLTDATTCHCVLSRLNETTELPAVMSAVAPHSNTTSGETYHRHENP